MNTFNAMAEVLKREGTEYLFCFPTLDLIEVVAQHGIRPIVCRQERVGMGMADAYSRISNGKRIGVFSMQAGPGVENAYPGITTAYADASPCWCCRPATTATVRDGRTFSPLPAGTRT